MAELSEKSFPFDSDEIEGTYDRSYLADDFARYFRAFISSGVFMKQSTNLQVIANGDMTVRLMPGAMIIDGYRYDVESDIIIQLDPADGVMNRIDRISATWSKEDRDVHYTLQKGELGFSPNPPACRRTADCKDYVLADVYIEAGAISIKQKDITDQRLNSKVCGLAFPFSDLDTSSFYAQLNDFYIEFVKKSDGSYDKFIEDMQAYLSGLETSGDSQLKDIVDTMEIFETMSEQDFLDWFNSIKKVLEDATNGEMLAELVSLMKNLYNMANQADIDRILNETYVDIGDTDGIFETATTSDIDDIISGDYVEQEENDNLFEDVDVETIVEEAFKEE